MKKGTLAATALAVGAGAASTTGSVAAQEEETGEAVVQAHDFYPDAEFTVIAQFETSTRNDFIEHYDPDEAELDDDYDVYSIRIETGGEGGTLAHLMIDNGAVEANVGDTGTMNATASFLNPDFNLLEIDVTMEPENDVDDDDEVDGDMDDDEVDDDDDVDDDMNNDEVNDDMDNDEVNDNEENDNDDGLFD
ncbi:calcium-binding protein [Natrarchaeobius chitinivorans]|uniref:Calcium-binding protein n=2 Tax=Natrarchaeobius chitinivorans TaxID=1679083 RepID=A0A3N6M0D6_NATCH|nr:calcium-binding protein [Natrarchaeobius chitinivorans]